MENEKKLLNETKYKTTTIILNIIGIIFVLTGIGAGIYLNVNPKIDKEQDLVLSIEEVESELSKEESRLKTLLTELKNETRTVRAEIEENTFNKIRKEELEDSISEELEIIKDIEQYFQAPVFSKGNETKKAKDLTEQLTTMKINKQISGTNIVGGEISKIGSIITTIVVVMFPLTIALMFFSFANKRSLAAFNAQSVVPVYKEVAEDVAPTVGKVVEEVVKGVKRANDDEEE